MSKDIGYADALVPLSDRVGSVVSDRHSGHSWGLEYPLVYGQKPGSDDWLVWDRHSGVITHIFPHIPNQHGWSDAKMKAEEASRPAGYYFNNFELDATP